MKDKTHYLMVGVICLALLTASCRRLGNAGPTARPSITPTPRSTPLPPLATPIPVGSEANPLHMQIVAAQSAATQQADDTTLTDLQQALLDGAQMNVTVERVDSDAEALAALCASPDGTVSAAWLSGIAYAAAYAQNCGKALLQVERGTRSSGAAGDQARILVKSGAGISAVSDLAQHKFCRLGYNDLYSWLIPSLMLQAGGLSLSDLTSIQDYDDANTMIGDLVAGKCDAVGIAGSQFDSLASDSARSAVHTLQQSVTIPYAVLVVPPELPLAQQKLFSDALISIGNGTRADLLRGLLNQDQIVAVNDGELSNLRSFISGAGIDLSQAGS